jgi:hypothetical protein
MMLHCGIRAMSTCFWSNIAQPRWLGMLHCGIRVVGSTLDLYWPEVNKKHQSSSFNTELA